MIGKESQTLAPDATRRQLKLMPSSFISEPILPVEASFDTGGMAMGGPGLPQKFLWREKEFVVAEVLERWKEHGDCRHGSGERYLRKHGYRVRTADGTVMKLYFQRSMGRGKLPAKSRWWIQSVE
jgi:phosphoribosylglycinamide formyltransferase-1